VSPKKASPVGWNRRYLAYAGGGVALVLAALALFFSSAGEETDSLVAEGADRGAEETPADTPTLERDTSPLFFVAEDGMSLVAHEEDLPLTLADDSVTRARIVVERQLGDAPSPLASPFPPGTELRAIYVTLDGVAFVDLNLDVTREHGGGSLDELFTVYALVNALTTNIPEISAVQILIDGREVDTLAGHIDLRRPLEPNMKWVDQPQQLTEPEQDEDPEE
jgi:hypothetical protein